MKNTDFDFCCPTKIYFRNEGVSEIGKIIKEDYSFKKVFSSMVNTPVKETDFTTR